MGGRVAVTNWGVESVGVGVATEMQALAISAADTKVGISLFIIFGGRGTREMRPSDSNAKNRGA